MASRLVDANGNLVPAPRSARRGGRMTSGRQRRRSTRYYLARAEDYLAAVDRGEISSADGARRVAMVRDITEMFLSHRVLEIQGQDGASDVTPTPEEGYEAPRLLPHRTKRVTAKRGTDKLGHPVDEKTVMIESSHAGDDVEADAEIEVLA